MKVKFILFENLLEENCRDVHVGILMEEKTVFCLCCFGVLFEEDYQIIETKEIEFERVDELISYVMEVRNEEKLI